MKRSPLFSITKAYSTTSTDALHVPSGCPPLDLKRGHVLKYAGWSPLQLIQRGVELHVLPSWSGKEHRGQERLMDASLHREPDFGNPYCEDVHPGTHPPTMEPNKGRQLPALEFSSLSTYLRGGTGI
ncbi:hypothetical protein AVEN_190722-1 [Araneus ventricosus]|uniref:Uncharacterized protein n=1 Tax=Araneus ventricosus TaxID=182803 RepID=A0A4Y2KVZ4_ARAVE|nr:hypothetical protein AVEN_190722-1 [Araneus ventricosus]